MLTLTSPTIWLRWEQAVGGGSGFVGSSGSGFAGSTLVAVECSLTHLSHSGFAGSKLVAVDLASLVGAKLGLSVAVALASLGASWWWWWNAHSHLSENLASLEAGW